ncbi:methyl-accepting chemotaxis protein [Natrialba sp. INN-245]|uniref:methyl-accepting chemotaxis protein n=1 Tax=Natrialba sp. INN-245 TaxID=2690967 RepID=UPI001311FF23|nr:methyl-accepting chemotaxis protein [Natrialba sp. INN-245]MWV38289.1 HAMP domain-containing protein [Natrialba sp. INN-245]
MFEKLVPSFIRRRYLVKFVISILAVVLVIGAVGAVSYAEIDETVRTDSDEQIESTAELQADAIGDWIENMRIQTRTVSSSPTLQEDNPPAIQGQLVEEQARMSADVRAIHYVDTAEGTVVTSTDAQHRETDLGNLDEPWTETDFDEEFPFSEAVWYSEQAYESSTLDDQVMAFASPVTERDDRVVVVVTTLEHRVDQLHQEEAAMSTTIVDGDGTQVLQADGVTLEDGSFEDDAVDAALGGRATQVHGEEYVQAYVAIPDTQWVAVTSVPTDQAYGVADDVRSNVLQMVLASLIALGVVGVVIGRQTVVPLGQLRDRVGEIEAGNLDVDLETSRTDEIGRLYNGLDSMRESLKMQIHQAESARTEAEQARAESEAMNEHLETKADEYSEVMQVCAEGDLTARMDPESESEAMASIATEFNEMIAEIEETTATVKSFATEVATASEQVTASSEEVRSASEQVTESVQEISEGADRQNENLQSVTREMNGLSTTTEEIAASSNEVADLAARTAETGERGREAAQEALEGMTEIETESEAAVEEIARLEREMEQIDELLEFIGEVAEQTNMLALNANIEASRSADSSEGFSVVAGEVKDLAEETKNAAADIERRLERIKSQTDRAAEEVQQTSDRVMEHTDSVERAADALEEIADYAVETNGGIQEISEASDEQANLTQEVVAMVDDVAAIAEETSAESETVAAAAEEQTTALTEVSQSADDLAGRAGHLSATLEEFDTGETVDEEPVPALEVGGGADAGDVDEGANPNGDDGEVDGGADDDPADARSDGSDTADSTDRSVGDDPFDETFTFEQVDDET